MSWVSENKFLTGFGGVILVGVGVLGYLTWSAMGKYETAVGEFDAAVGALKSTEGSKPSPNEANLKELAAQEQEVSDKVDALQKDLKSHVLATEPLTKEQFQDKLKESVARVSAKALERNVLLGEKQDKFYMGYARYQSAPPDDAAAPALGRQLRAIELIMGILISDSGGGIELKKLDREELPEERGVKRAKSSDQSGKKKSGKDSGGENAGHHLVDKSSVTVKFLGPDKALRQVMNALAAHKQQFFIIRTVSVQNEKLESPQKLSAATPLAPTPGPSDAPNPAEAPPVPAAVPAAPTPPAAVPSPAPAAPQGSLQYAFGTEKVEATLEIEILDFADPEARQEKPAKGKGK